MKKTALLLLFYLGLHSYAVACAGPLFEKTIFLKAPESRIQADVIARVTLVKLVAKRERGRTVALVAFASVDQVLKGAIKSNEIKLVAPHGSCDERLHVGMSGIVAGSLAYTKDGPEFMPVRESRWSPLPGGGKKTDTY